MISGGTKDSSAAFKIVFVGDTRVGKTSLIYWKTAHEQIGNQKPTVGSHCTELTFNLATTTVIMQIWDTAGQEMYRSLVPVYLREARAVVLVFDVTDEESFHGLSEWYTLLNDTLSETVPVYLIGNKIDLEKEIVITDEMAKVFAASHKAKFRRASALTGYGVDALFQEIAEDFAQSGYATENWKLVLAPAHSKSCVC
jgi:small GTP-binding protein